VAADITVTLRIDEGPFGRRVCSVGPIASGARVLTIGGRPSPAPDMYSIQLSADLHLTPEGALWGFVNHSCDPNLVVDFDRWQLVACREIAPGEELTWNYLTAEWALQSPFECGCGARSCVRRVRGFRYLASLERSAIAGMLSPFLRSQLHSDDSASSEVQRSLTCLP
jgi:hypothetical protein